MGRYDDRDYDRGRESYGRGREESGRGRQNYGGRGAQDYGRGGQDYGRSRNQEYGQERLGPRSRFDRDEGERYSTEDRWRGDYGSSSRELGSSRTSRPWREGEYGRDYSGSGLDWAGETDFSDERRQQSRYGSTGRGYDTGEHYGDTSNPPSQRYNYPTGSRSRETYGGHGAYEDYGSRYLRDEGSDYDYGRGASQDDRGWWDRASDEVASWFGDDEATRRRRMDHQRDEYRGRGPKNYRRSDQRITEDINDRLSEGYLDATDIEVAVSGSEATLTGTVKSRADKRRAEAIAESVTGVSNVENRLRVKQNDYGTSRYSGTEMSGATSPLETTNTAASMGSTGTTGTTGTSDTSTITGTSSKRAGSGS